MILTIIRDLRFGLRLLGKSKGFAAVAILTLAVGIGATTGMFSVVSSLLLRPLPYEKPDRLVLIKEVLPSLSHDPTWIPAPDVLTFQQESTSFEDVGGFAETQIDLTGIGDPTRIDIVRITANTFPILGISPILGRTFSADEDRPGSAVAVLSYGCWQHRFGGSADVLRKTIELDRKPHSIIGVMPPGFMIPLETPYPTPPELWVPMAFSDQERAARASLFIYGAIARLKPSVTLAQAQADAGSVMPHIIDGYPTGLSARLKTEAAVIPLEADTYRTVRGPLYIMLAAVGFVLLIAVANVANLTLARGSARQKEFAIRVALGASGRNLLTQLVTESVALALIGGAAGVGLAALITKQLLAAVPESIPQLGAAASELDLKVLLFALAVSAASGMVFGAAPAFFALRANVNDRLKEGGRSNSLGKQHQRLRSGFVIVQVALALILLVGSGLLLRSFQNVVSVKGGFRPEHVTVGSLFLSTTGYPTSEKVQRFLAELVDQMQQIPGSRSAAVSTDVPLRGGWQRMIVPEGYDPPPGAGLNPGLYTVIQGDYFQTMGIPLIAGRFFSPEESGNGARSVIISESFAKRYFPGQDPVGRRLQYVIQKQAPWLNIVGVVGDIKQTALEEETLPHTYTPMTAEEIPILQRIGGVSAQLSVRSGEDASADARGLQSAVWSLDRQLPVTDVMNMEQVMNLSTAPRRFAMTLVVSFSAVALLLASIGLYGVIAYSVNQRVHEIGVRMALGAGPRTISRMVLGWGVSLIVVGIGVGIAGAAAATQLLRGLLFGVQPLDPLTLAAVIIVLGAVAIAACYIPAIRATRVDPINALRNE